MAAPKKASARTRSASTKTKKAAPKKAAVKKAAPKKKTTVTKPKTKTPKTPKLKPAKKNTFIKETPVSLPRTVVLAKLNPFRLPMKIDTLMVQTARFAGMAFVLLGAASTLYHLNAFDRSFSALERMVSTASVCSISDENCTLGVNYLAISGSTQTATTDADKAVAVTSSDEQSKDDSTVDATPDVTFVYEESNDGFFGSVSIYLRVSDAEAVEVRATDSETGQDFKLGVAEHESEDRWRISWDTKEYRDGKYRLRAIVSNRYGEYEQRDGGYVRVQNTTVDSENDTSNDEDATDGSENKTEPSADVDEVVKTDDDAIHSDGVNGDAKEAEDVTVVTVKEPTRIIDPDDDTAGYQETLKPPVVVSLQDSSALAGKVDIKIAVSEASFVEVYAIPKFSINRKFIGLASRIDTENWNLRFDTRNVPNGSYTLIARVKNSFGAYETSGAAIKITNEIKQGNSSTSADGTDQTKAIVAEAIGTKPRIPELETQEKREVEKDETEEIESDSEDNVAELDESVDEVITEQVKTTTTSESVAVEKTRDILVDFKDEIDEELQRLSSAIRTGEASGIARATDRLERLRDRIITASLEDNNSEVLALRLDQRIADIFARLRTDTEKTEAIIKERVGEEISRDTDKDGITDYDERTLYNTDPEVADSDGDGFTDGAEVLGGFDPKNSEPEALVEFESPKEAGITRADILKVEQITTAVKTENDIAETGVAASAVISGTALPNSFVTLYIFSTPIVITMKTDAQGAWVYRFDKELDDGEHEVYVGVTDNAGKIVAKSEPLRFVKEAQAFTPVDSAAGGAIGVVTQSDNSLYLISQNTIMIILSVSVFGIGVALILVGLHLANRREEEQMLEQQLQSQAV